MAVRGRLLRMWVRLMAHLPWRATGRNGGTRTNQCPRYDRITHKAETTPGVFPGVAPFIDHPARFGGRAAGPGDVALALAFFVFQLVSADIAAIIPTASVAGDEQSYPVGGSPLPWFLTGGAVSTTTEAKPSGDQGRWGTSPAAFFRNRSPGRSRMGSGGSRTTATIRYVFRVRRIASPGRTLIGRNRGSVLVGCVVGGLPIVGLRMARGRCYTFQLESIATAVLTQFRYHPGSAAELGLGERLPGQHGIPAAIPGLT